MKFLATDTPIAAPVAPDMATTAAVILEVFSAVMVKSVTLSMVLPLM